MMNAIGIKRYRRVAVLVSMKACKQIELIYLYMHKNGIGFHLMMDMFIAFGVDSIFELIENKTITDIWQLLRVMKCMRETVPEYVTESKESQPFVSLSTMKDLNDLFHEYKFNKEQQDSFYRFFMENYIDFLGRDKIIANNHSINIIMKAWINDTSRNTSTDPK